MARRKVVTTTPAGTVITMEYTGNRGRDGLDYMTVTGFGVGSDGTKHAKPFIHAIISFNVAWAMMRGFDAFLPEIGADCKVEVLHD